MNKTLIMLGILIVAFLIPVVTALFVAKSGWAFFGLVPLLFFFSRDFFHSELVNSAIVASVVMLVIGILIAVGIVIVSAEILWFTILMLIVGWLVFPIV